MEEGYDATVDLADEGLGAVDDLTGIDARVATRGVAGVAGGVGIKA